MRGLGFRERTGSAIAPAALTEIDRLWTAGATLAAIDPLLSSYIRGRHLLLALRAGDPFRISLGLALEAIQRAMRGANAYPAARRILDRARELAVRSDQRYAEGIVSTGEASVAHLSGRARDALRVQPAGGGDSHGPLHRRRVGTRNHSGRGPQRTGPVRTMIGAHPAPGKAPPRRRGQWRPLHAMCAAVVSGRVSRASGS